MMKERRNEQLKTDKFAGKLTNYFLFEHVYTAQHQQMYSPSPASPLLRTWGSIADAKSNIKNDISIVQASLKHSICHNPEENLYTPHTQSSRKHENTFQVFTVVEMLSTLRKVSVVYKENVTYFTMKVWYMVWEIKVDKLSWKSFQLFKGKADFCCCSLDRAMLPLSSSVRFPSSLTHNNTFDHINVHQFC